jgi:hypothetical protein
MTSACAVAMLYNTGIRNWIELYIIIMRFAIPSGVPRKRVWGVQTPPKF